MHVSGVNREGFSSVPRTFGATETVQSERAAPESGGDFRRSLSAELSGLRQHPTVRNAAVSVSPEGLMAMREDPEYREKVLALIQRDIGSSYAPRNASVSIQIGATLEDYRADSWPVGHDGEYHAVSAGALWKRERDDRTSGEDYLGAFSRRMSETRIPERRRMGNERNARLEKQRRAAESYDSHMSGAPPCGPGRLYNG